MIKRLVFEARWTLGYWMRDMKRAACLYLVQPIYWALPYVRRWHALPESVSAVTEPEDWLCARWECAAADLLRTVANWLYE